MDNPQGIKVGDKVRLKTHGAWEKILPFVGKVLTVERVWETGGTWYVKLTELKRISRQHSRSLTDVEPVTLGEADPNGIDAHSPGAKLDAGKVLASQILSQFPRALNGVAEVGSFGARKYTMGGWLSVPNGIVRYADAKVRHWLARARGENFDKDSKLHHLKHEAWNVLAELELTLQEEEKASASSN